MSNVKISALPSTALLAQSDILPVVSGGATKSSTVSNLWEPTAVANANYTILATDVLVYTSVAFTAPHSWTLPSAASYGAGRLLRVVDLLGTLTPTNTLTLTRAGSDTINGLTSKVLATAFQSCLLVCDGISAWSIVALGIVAAGDFSSNTSTSVDGEIVLFSGTAGKTGKRATGTGIAKLTAGVLGTGTAKTDYWDTSVFVASGGSHAIGLVPDPGASAGTTKFLCEDATWKAPSAGLLAFAGSLTSVTNINITTTDTTGGITLANQTAAAGTLWRVRFHAQYVAANNATARNMQITVYWGATALIQTSIVVTPSQANTWNLEGEYLLNGTGTTAIWESGYTHCETGAALKPTWLAPASTAVPSGAQTIDLRFSMSATGPVDNWSIDGVTIERLK